MYLLLQGFFNVIKSIRRAQLKSILILVPPLFRGPEAIHLIPPNGFLENGRIPGISARFQTAHKNAS